MTHLRRHRDRWVKYDNDCERKKWACNAVGEISSLVRDVFAELAKPLYVNELADLTGITDLSADPDLWGAGIHVVEPGGYLGAHLDYALCPHRPGFERRVNLILFLNEGKGGAFELYDDMARNVVSRVDPVAGRAVVWCPGDVEFHGTGLVTGDVPRITAAVYYLAPARPTATRKRALYAPMRNPPR